MEQTTENEVISCGWNSRWPLKETSLLLQWRRQVGGRTTVTSKCQNTEQCTGWGESTSVRSVMDSPPLDCFMTRWEFDFRRERKCEKTRPDITEKIPITSCFISLVVLCSLNLYSAKWLLFHTYGSLTLWSCTRQRETFEWPNVNLWLCVTSWREAIPYSIHTCVVRGDGPSAACFSEVDWVPVNSERTGRSRKRQQTESHHVASDRSLDTRVTHVLMCSQTSFAKILMFDECCGTSLENLSNVRAYDQRFNPTSNQIASIKITQNQQFSFQTTIQPCDNLVFSGKLC